MEGDAELLFYVVDDGVGEVDYFVGGCSAEVYQYEGLVLIDSCPTEGSTFPAGFLYEA